MSILRVFSIAGHGKGEVDHVGGGGVKVAIRRHIGSGGFLSNAADMVEYLQQVCTDKHNPPYYIKEIESTSLEIGRADAHLKKFPTIDGSTLFQVMLFKPHLTYIKAAPHLCLCSECLEDYGSCHRCVEYELVVHELNKVSLRSEKLVFEGESEAIEDFLLPKSYCAVSADQKAKDTI